MKKLLHILCLLSFFILSSCTTTAFHFPGVYAIDVEQGNIIDQEMIDQLRPNMNKRQVLYVMGTPMLIDIFHEERWDYVNSEQPGGDDRMQKRISLYFKDDVLSRVDGDFRPSSLPVPRPSNEETVDVPKRILEKTLYEKIVGLFSSDDIDTQAKPVDTTQQLSDTDSTAQVTSESLQESGEPLQDAVETTQQSSEGLQSYPLAETPEPPTTDPAAPDPEN